MKKIILVLVVAFATVSFKNESKKKDVIHDPEELNVIVENSTVNWKGFKPTGEHFGIITISEGSIKIDHGKLVGGSFTFDMNSIVVTDMPADNEYNAKLVGHLKSDDFFDVEKYPVAKFVLTEVKNGDGKLRLKGDLTIKETTKQVTIPVSLSDKDGVVTLKSESFKINRADYNVRYGSKSFFDDLKDKFIYDEFEMSFEVKASK